MPSFPARGAWIEISCCSLRLSTRQSFPARGAWIEISSGKPKSNHAVSFPARGAWIEILPPGCDHERRTVVPRKGSVD